MAGSVSIEDLTSNIDAMFVIVCGVCVLAMRAGYMMLELSSTRSSNYGSVLLQNLCDFIVGLVLYHSMGYWVSFGFSHRVLIHDPEVIDLSTSSHIFFNVAIASATSTIITGALIERTKYTSYMIFSTLFSSVQYPVVVRLLWADDGWFSERNGDPLLGMPVLDFGGGGAIHLMAGCAGLTAAILLGPRHGFSKHCTESDVDGEEDFSVKPFGSSTPGLKVIGTISLFATIIASNCGFLGGISGTKSMKAGQIINVTAVAGACGGLMTLLVQERIVGKLHIDFVCNGILAGLIASCSGSRDIEPWSAMFLGCLAAVAYLKTTRILFLLRIDDPLNVFAVHGSGGAISLIGAGIFSKGEHPGIVFGGKSQLGVQLFGLVAIALWSIFTTGAFLWAIDKLFGLRVPERAEINGLDRSLGIGMAQIDSERMGQALIRLGGLRILAGDRSSLLLWKFRDFLLTYRSAALPLLDFLVSSETLLKAAADLNLVPLAHRELANIRQMYSGIYARYLAAESIHRVSLPQGLRQQIKENSRKTEIDLEPIERSQDVVCRYLDRPWCNFLDHFSHNTLILDQAVMSTWAVSNANRRNSDELTGPVRVNIVDGYAKVSWQSKRIVESFLNENKDNLDNVSVTAVLIHGQRETGVPMVSPRARMKRSKSLRIVTPDDNNFSALRRPINNHNPTRGESESSIIPIATSGPSNGDRMSGAGSSTLALPMSRDAWS